MMTAMARLPCKSTNAQQQQQQQQPFRQGNDGYGASSRNYWDMQRPATYTRNQHRQIIDHTGKRKSAVELLQESKAFYVKSETVLDRKQELKNSGHLQVAPSTNAPPRLLRKCTNSDRSEGISSPQRTLPPALPPKSPRLISLPQRRAISGPPSITVGDQLQTKLRRLLNTDSKENIHHSESPVSPPNLKSPSSPIPLNCQLSPAGQSCLEVRFKFGRSNSHSHASTKTSDRKSGSGNSSPPAICQTTTCHKSLPDLHSARRRASLSPRASTRSPNNGINTSNPINTCPDCETSSDSDRSFKRDSVCYRSSRHIRRSLGSGNDASSVLSSGGRTQKSSGSSKLSHGATARDSGGSSGHCTHRSEPPPRLQDCWGHIRRDSGASTQHSTEKERSRKGSCVSGTPPSVLRNLSPESDSSPDCSPTRNSRLSDGWKEGRGRPILRSKSDISDRYWRHENGRSYDRKKPPAPPRPPRTVSELEHFFDRLGLDPDNYERMTIPGSNSSSPVFFDSVSSVDSALGLHQWSANQSSAPNEWQNNCSMGHDEASQRVSDPPSIVERNARIIKWLCQCRKVQFGYS